MRAVHLIEMGIRYVCVVLRGYEHVFISKLTCIAGVPSLQRHTKQTQFLATFVLVLMVLSM